MAKKNTAVCEHSWGKEYFGGWDTGDLVCSKCGATKTRGEDPMQAARRVVDEATGARPKTKK